MDASRLIELAEARLRLSDDERCFLAGVLTYRDIPARATGDDGDSSAVAATLAPQRRLSARLLMWLCTDADAAAEMPYWGLRVFNARIEGGLNLEYAAIEFPLIFHRCCFTEAVRLECASLPSLDLSGSQLQGSEITDLDGDVITAALAATNLQVEHHLRLCDGFEAEGGVWLSGAKIGGQFDCSGGQFHNPDGKALNAQGAEIRESLILLDGFEAVGAVWLAGTKIEGQLDCRGSKFHNLDGYALFAQGAEIREGLFLRNGFEAKGTVWLSGAKIGGQLNCSGGQFYNPDGDALFAQGAEIGENLFLCDGFEVAFKATGRVWLLSAKIGGQLDCSGGQFYNPDGDALFAQGAEIGEDLFLRDRFKATGVVWLAGATIGGQLDCSGGKFYNPDGDALNARGAEIGEGLVLSDGFEATGAVDLSFATARVLDDRKQDWPAVLYLDGFTYEKLSPFAPVKGQERLDWLRRCGDASFSPQPYEQLAAVLRASGHDGAATRVLIGQQDDRIRLTDMHPIHKGWNRLLGVAIGHGYRSQRALYWAAGLIGVGALLFQWGYAHSERLITPSGVDISAAAPARVSADYPAFNALMYSTDVFLPIIDLHQQSYWLPNANRGLEVSLLMVRCRQGALLRWFFWGQIILGWGLTSLWVAGFTGLVRKLE